MWTRKIKQVGFFSLFFQEFKIFIFKFYLYKLLIFFNLYPFVSFQFLIISYFPFAF